MPLGWVGLAALYGIKYNDQGLVAGVAAGYLTFALGLLWASVFDHNKIAMYFWLVNLRANDRDGLKLEWGHYI